MYLFFPSPAHCHCSMMIFRDEMISRKEMVAHSVDVVILDSTC